MAGARSRVIRSAVSAAACALAGIALAALAATSSSSEEIYKLAREALARGSFETAARLFRVLEDDPKYAADGRYAFNRAQASRFAGAAGEAVYWYGKYLAIEPNAADAKSVHEQIAKLVQTNGAAVRAEAVRLARAEFAAARENPELERALSECAAVRLNVRFRKAADAGEGTAYLHPGRAVFWKLAPEEGASSVVWVAATEPVAAPVDSAAPPLLLLPPGRPFPLTIGPDLSTLPAILTAAPPPGFAPDPELASWRIEVTAELDRMGPRLLLVGARPGQMMAEVESGPFDGPVALGKKKRELPVVAAPLAFGPRAPVADAKTWPGAQLLVVDLPGKDGAITRWAAPVGWFTVVNAFGRAIDTPGGERFTVRPEGTGPFLVPLLTRR